MARFAPARPLATDAVGLFARPGRPRLVAPLCATPPPAARHPSGPRDAEDRGLALGMGLQHMPPLLRGFTPGAGTPSGRSVSCAARQGRKGHKKGPPRTAGPGGGREEDPEAVEVALEELFLELARDLELGEGQDPGALDIGGEGLSEEEMLALEQELNSLLGPGVQEMLDDPTARDAAEAFLAASDEDGWGAAPTPGADAPPSGSPHEEGGGQDASAEVARDNRGSARAGVMPQEEVPEATVPASGSSVAAAADSPLLPVGNGDPEDGESGALHSAAVGDSELRALGPGSSAGPPGFPGGAGFDAASQEGVEGTQGAPTTAPSDGVRGRTVAIQEWQLKKLVKALRQGRRHVNVKALAAELKMDRRDVLTWLRRPPPEAVQLAATGEAWLAPARDRTPPVRAPGGRSEAVSTMPRSREQGSAAQDGLPGPGPSPGAEGTADAERWDRAGKRIGREQLATLEAVFQRTRHPTGTMIASLTSLTNLPRRRILQWFTTRREDATRKQASPESKPSSAWKAVQ